MNDVEMNTVNVTVVRLKRHWVPDREDGTSWRLYSGAALVASVWRSLDAGERWIGFHMRGVRGQRSAIFHSMADAVRWVQS